MTESDLQSLISQQNFNSYSQSWVRPIHAKVQILAVFQNLQSDLEPYFNFYQP